MSMSLPETVTRLQSPLHDHIARQKPGRAERYRAAVEQHELCAVLGRFADDADATRFVKDDTNPQDERADVVRAFFYCYQQDPDEQWSSCILAVFSGLLGSVRTKVRPAGMDDSEVGQLLALHLLTIARTMDVTNPKLLVFKRTKQQLREDVFLDVAKERSNYRRRMRFFHERGGKDADANGDADADADSDDEDRCTAMPKSIREQYRRAHDGDSLVVETAPDVDGRRAEREQERYRHLLAFAREKLSPDEYELLTCITEDQSMKDIAAAATDDVDDAHRLAKDYAAARGRKSRLHEKVRRLLRESGWWEALGPEIAVPTFGIA
jgi:hypothetical protein